MKKGMLNIILSVLVVIALTYTAVVIYEIPVYIVILVYLLIIAALAFAFRVYLISLTANFYFMSGSNEKARAYFKKAIAKKTKSALVYLNYSIMLIREGTPAEAFIHLENAKKYNKDPYTQKNIELTLGSCYWINGEIDTAIEILEGMRQKYEYVNNHLLTTLGYLYITKKELDKAREATEAAIAEAPESFAAWDNLGQIEFLENNLEKAKECFSKALSIRAELPDSLYFMGLICETEGDLENAKEYFTKAKNSKITALSTITVEQVDEKLAKY